MSDPMSSAWQAQRDAMGAFIRSQRELANMSLREMSKVTRVSNAYLSQIERGLHDPTLRVLVQIANALNLSVEDLLREGGGLDADAVAAVGALGVEAAVMTDPLLTDSEKDALVSVYRSYVGDRERPVDRLA